MGKRTRLSLVLLVGALCTIGTTANAWVITQVDPASGANLAEVEVTYVDERDSGEILYEIDKYFLSDLVSGGPVMLQFTREAADTASTIVIVDEYIVNMTSAVWSDYHVFLVNDPAHLDRTATFVDSDNARAWQQFGGQTRLDGAPTSALSTQIDWETAVPSQEVPYGTVVDVPENQLVITGLQIDVSTLQTNDSFLLGQAAAAVAIPEPVTLVLFGGGVAAVLVRRRRFR